MSHISTGVEYGLHCLLYLTKSHASVEEACVRDLAALQGVPHDYLAKLFTKLAKADLVIATEGVRGGYRLARAAESITVHDVIVAIDGKKALFECREIRGRCAVFEGEVPAWGARGVCSIHAVMQFAEKAMRAELKRHTLDDLAKRFIDKAPNAYSGQVVKWLVESQSNRRLDTPIAKPTTRRKVASPTRK